MAAPGRKTSATDEGIGGIKVHRGGSFLGGGELGDFNLPKGNLSTKSAEEVVEVCRRCSLQTT